MNEPCSREVVKVFDDILKGIAGEKKMKHCERLIICPTCMTTGKEDRGFRDIGEGFQVNDKSEECSDLFGESCDSDDEDIDCHSSQRMWSAEEDVSTSAEGKRNNNVERKAVDSQ